MKIAGAVLAIIVFFGWLTISHFRMEYGKSVVAAKQMREERDMKVPFFANTGDGTHCFQASLMMALGVVMPDREFTYDELDEISAKEPGKWTWPTAAMLWMLENNLDVRLIEDFDYTAFVQRGEDYIIERYGEEVGKAQAENSDIERELDYSRRFMKIAPLEVRVPTLDDIRSELNSGAVVIVNLNSAVLNDSTGYAGHFVVVTDVGESTVKIHDPGLPPQPNMEIPIKKFLTAWAYPVDRDKNLLAIARR
jgi:hypothetical protein